MQIVIDIDESEYNKIKRANDNYLVSYEKNIKNGTPLPKRHGRLIDADKLIEKINQFDYYDQVLDASTIIEADKEE